MKGKSLKEIAIHLGLSSQNFSKISHFSIDSRQIEKGTLFFALRGKKADGHQYLREVADRGASGAIVSRDYSGPDFGMELLKVEDVRNALQLLAKIAFALRKEKVVGVTGSMGKTTTKEFLSTLLTARYRVAKTPGNHNTQLTFPLTLLNLEGEFDVLVLEMGMNLPGEITRLVQIAPPDIALLTRIAPAGMEDFRGGLMAIAQAKAEIFSHWKTRLGIISNQAARFKEVLYAGSVPKWIYGWRDDFVDPRLGDYVMEENSQGIFIQDSPALKVTLQGDHLKENFLAAVTAARALGLSWSDIQEKALELKPYERRFQKIEKEGVTFIQDCYNANPDSVCAALKNLPKPAKNGKIIGVLGTMPDLGMQSEYYHKQVGAFAKKYVDRLLCIGNHAISLANAFSEQGGSALHFSDLALMKKELFSLVSPGDVVLIKGANSLELWKLLESL